MTRVLDVGTGSGILALMLAQRHDQAVVEAVELEPDAARQAAENVASSPYSSRITVHAMALQAWDEADVDLVVCNLLFHNHPKSPERKRNLARHDDTLPLRVLFAEAHRVTHESGVFQFVFPTERAAVRVAGTEGAGVVRADLLRWSAAHEPIRDLDVGQACKRGASSSRSAVDAGHRAGELGSLVEGQAFCVSERGLNCWLSSQALDATCPPGLATGLLRLPPRPRRQQNR